VERIVVVPHQDVVYGFGPLSLDRKPAVIQVPDFGDRSWVYRSSTSALTAFAHRSVSTSVRQSQQPLADFPL